MYCEWWQFNHPVAEPNMDTLASLGNLEWSNLYVEYIGDPIYMWLSRRVRNSKWIPKQINWIPLTTQISKSVHNSCGYRRALLHCNPPTELSLSPSLSLRAKVLRTGSNTTVNAKIRQSVLHLERREAVCRIHFQLVGCNPDQQGRLEQLRQIISTCTDIVRPTIWNWGEVEDSGYPCRKPSFRSARRSGRA